MPIDTDAQRVIDLIRALGRPPMETMTYQEAREAYRASRRVLQPEPEDVAEARALAAPGPAGDIPLRLYRPAGSPPGAVLPALIYLHGGGWVIGDLDSHDGVCRGLANAGGCAVLSVEYRLAPEHRYPAAAEDSLAASSWVMANAAALAVDPARIAVGGDSAGGNLAAIVALAARDGALPAPCFQLLIYPSTDMAGHYPSYDRVTEGFPLTTATMHWFVDHYLGDRVRAGEWQASPLRAASLAGTPPALVLTAGYDPLCDEGLAYAARLERDGVRTVSLQFPTQMHGFLTMGRFIRASGTAIAMMGAALRQAFAPPPL